MSCIILPEARQKTNNQVCCHMKSNMLSLAHDRNAIKCNWGDSTAPKSLQNQNQSISTPYHPGSQEYSLVYCPCVLSSASPTLQANDQITCSISSPRLKQNPYHWCPSGVDIMWFHGTPSLLLDDPLA